MISFIVIGALLAQPSHLSGVRPCHTISTDGRQTWQEGPKRRYFVPKHIDRSFDGEFLWKYSVPENSLTKSAIGEDGFGTPIGTIEEIIDERKTLFNQFSLRTENNGGKLIVTLQWYEWDTVYAWIRSRYECDPKSRLPILMQAFSKGKEGYWKPGATTKFEFPTDIPDETFVLKANGKTKFFDRT